MNFFRKIKRDDFTIIDNSIFKNKNLSLKAKGLLCTLLSLPDNWNFSEIGLSKLSNDGRTSIRNTLQELENNGYFTREQLKDEKGQYTNCIYSVYENPLSENPLSENEHNKILNNKELNNKILNNNISKVFKKPTLEEVQAYCVERNNGVDAETFIDFYESKGWKVGKTPMKDWKACIRTWERSTINKQNERKEIVYETI